MNINSTYLKKCLENFSSISNDEQVYIFKFYMNNFYNLVYSYVRNHFSTEDILQEVFIKILNTDLTYICDDKIIAWLFIVTKNNTMNYIRKNKKKYFSLNIDEFDNRLYNSNDFSDYLIIKDLKQYIYTLPLNLRKTVYLRVIMQLTYKEIAQKLEISEGSVRQNLYRARKNLRECYH